MPSWSQFFLGPLTMPWGRQWVVCSHFTDDETEAHRGEGICLRGTERKPPRHRLSPHHFATVDLEQHGFELCGSPDAGFFQ